MACLNVSSSKKATKSRANTAAENNAKLYGASVLPQPVVKDTDKYQPEVCHHNPAFEHTNGRVFAWV